MDLQNKKIEKLIRTKNYASLSTKEITFVNTVCSQEEYENKYFLFQNCSRYFNEVEEKDLIPEAIKNNIFIAFKASKVKSKKNYFNYSSLKPIIAIAATVILLFLLLKQTKDSTLQLTINEFNKFTTFDDFCLLDKDLNEVTFTMKTMTFNTKLMVENFSSKEWESK